MRHPSYFWLLAIYPGAWGDVQQQNLITRTVTLTHAQDPSWPDGSDSEDSQVWTNNNQNVKINSIIDIEFAENIQESIGYITVQPPILLIGTSTASATTIPVPSVDVSVSGAKLTLTPPSCTPPCVRSDVFAEETVYTVSFDAGVIQNLAGTDSNAAFSVQFTTGDFTAPVLLTSSPADDTPNVAVTSSIVFTFSENIQVNAAASFIWQIQDKHGEQSPTTYSAPCNDAQVSVSGAVATITILASNFPLLPCQWYQVVYAAQCFTDTSTNLNYVAALPSTDYYDWWTSCITAYSPAIGTYGVPINSDIILTFSEAIVRGTGNIIFTPLGEASQSYDVTDTARVLIDSTQTQVTIVGDVSPNYLCLSLGSDMQKCKGKPVDITIAAGVFTRVDTTGLAAGDYDLKDQLIGSDYRFTLTPADLTPPIITVVSMYGITENVIRVTIRLSESGTTYCRAYDSGSFNPVSQGGTDVPTLTDCTSCAFEIKTSSGVNFVGSSTYDSSTSFAEHEVDVSGLTAKTFYWVYCYSHDDEIPTVNVATSSQMLATEQSVRTLDTTPPSFTRFSCVETPGTEDSITVTLSMNEAGRAYCKVVNKGFDPPTNNAVISEGFYFETSTMSEFNITVNKISTGLGATGMEALHRKWDYDVYCWGQDAEGYPYYGPNGMASPEACPSNPVTTLDLTRPSLRFIMAESISSSQIIITLQVNEGARVWCAAWTTDPGFTDTASAVSGIKGQSSNCMDNKGRQCGTFWIYDLDDLEDTAADGVTTLNEYYSTSEWRFNQDFDIIVSGLMEQTNYPYIYCYAEDDETDGIGSSPNTMIFDATGNAGPDNIHTIWAGTGTVQTLDESPPEFTTLTVKDPSDQNDRLVVTFALNEAGTAYCRVTRSDSGETDLRINRILSADYYATVSAASILGTITIDKLESSDTKSLYEASQYDVYCWAMDSAVNTQGLARPNYQTQAYVNTPVGTTLAHAQTSPSGGKTTYVWVKDLTPPTMIYVSNEALSEDTIQITLQLDEPGTVWCVPTLTTSDSTYMDTTDITSANYKDQITGATAPVTFQAIVPQAYTNVDLEVNRVVRDDDTAATLLSRESLYNIYCFAADDWDFEATGAAQQSINFQTANVGPPNEVPYSDVTAFSTAVGQVVTLDLTPPTIQINSVSTSETTITVNLELSETGTAWCQAVRQGFNVPTILEILDSNFTTEYIHYQPTTVPVDVVIEGYDRPRNWDPTYMTPLQLGTYYDIYCYADDDLCVGCKVTNGVSFNYVSTSANQLAVRTLDLTPPQMRYISAESIAHDQIIITLQVDEGAKVWCAAWATDPVLSATADDYVTRIKAASATCADNLGNQCGTFWVYDLDDIVDVINAADGVTTRAEYEATTWKYNRDVDIIVSGLQEETDYPYIYCYAEDDELTPNKMIFDTAANAGSSNVYTMSTEIGTIQTLDETAPSFTKLSITDPTDLNDQISITMALNEAGTTYCRTTLSKSGVSTLRINQILAADFSAVVTGPNIDGTIVIDALERGDTQGLYEGEQYDVYCWAKDSAVDTQGAPRPNYMTQAYLETDVGSNYLTAPAGGATRYVWLKDTTPPTMLYVTSEALTDSKLQITLQLDEPGTVWCQPVLPSAGADLDVADIDATNYITKIKTANTVFSTIVPLAYRNVDVEVDYIDNDAGTASTLLQSESPYNVFCFAEDDWSALTTSSADKSPNWNAANVPTPNMTVGNGNEVAFISVDNFMNTVGQILTLDLTPPTINPIVLVSDETNINVTVSLDEAGTVWCQAVRKDFNPPTILEILDTNYYSFYNGASDSTVEITGYDKPINYLPDYERPLVLGTDYDVYCYATDDLCVGCRNPNGVTFSTVVSTKLGIRTKDYTMPELRFVATESIANDKIIITVQVDEGAMIWCAAWSTDPAFTDSTDAENQIKSQQTNCEDGRGNQCGTFWVYDLDDIEDADADGVTSRTDYDDIYKWKYNQDVDIIVSGLTEETNYPFIYCFAQDDEVPANKMIFDSTGNFGPSNVYTLQQGIGTVQTLDESPPIFTELTIPDPTALNDRIVITFKLNEAGTAYCRTKRSDSAEPTLHINQILSADFSAEIIDPTLDTGTITLTSLERRNPASVIYEASQYDIYCWARDSAVDSHGFSRPNYMTQSYVETPVGVVTSPAGGLTENVWVVDTTAPSIIVVAREALAESTVQVTLQLNEPGTIWCQVADQDGSSFGTRYCQNSALEWTVTTDPCYAETWIQGVSRSGTDNTQFMKEVGTAYQDFDIDMTQIEKVTSPVGGESMLGNYNVHVWCFAQDDWVQQAPTPSPSPSFVAPTLPNKVDQSHMTAVNLAIGQITTRDQTPPTFTTTPISAALSETSLQITLTLDEAGTIWCMPVRSTFAEPSINEILQNNEYTSGCTTSCIVTMANLDAKTLYDIWCYAEDDNVYPQIPNGQKFTAAEVQTISTQDTTPPILTIVSAESPISSDIRIKVKMDEPGTVWCNSFQTGTAYQPASPTSASDWFNAVVGGGFLAYVGFPGLTPNSPINTNVEVVVSGLAELTQYDTYCAAQDASTLPSINQNVEATILNTFPALGQITTLDQSPPVYEELGASGIDENTIRVTFKCNEACRAYCRVTRSDSGETSLSINRILKADYYADQLGSGGASSTIDLQRLENDATLTLLDRGTLYDVFCWSRDEAVQHSCWAEGAGATCSTYPRNNYQAQSYVDTVFGGTPPSTITNGAGLPGGKILHVRTPDTTAPVIIFVEAESTEESSITVTLQLDEPGTAYCKAYTTMQSADSTLYTALTTSPIYSNTVTNWNNIYRNFDIKVSGLTMETKYYVYCAAEDDEMVEGASTISPAPTSNNQAIPVLTESSGRFTLDLTPPIISVQAISSATENTATVTLQLDEPGTAWCSAVRDQLTPPSINQIIAADFSNTVTTANTDFTVRVENLMRDTEYDVYCHARDRGTEVEVGITPDAGNPGNDVDHTHVLTTKRDIHTLGDSTAPIVSSVSPAHMQTGVAVKPTLQIVFNEDIKVGGAGTGEVHLFPATPGSPPSGSGQITLYVSDVASGVCNPAKLTIYLTTFTADWSACGASSPLSSSMDWYVTFAAGVFQDTVGNDVAAFGASNTYYFQTA